MKGLQLNGKWVGTIGIELIYLTFDSLKSINII